MTCVSLSVSNWGSELDEDLLYHHGNEKPLGFGEKFKLKQFSQLSYLLSYRNDGTADM